MLTRLDLVEQELYDAEHARPRDDARYLAALEQAVQACRTDPAAAELFDEGGLYLDLSVEYQEADRYDDALAAVDAAVEAGLQMRPDARCLRAEVVMQAGRVAEAEPIWAAVRADTPDEVLLYSNAGREYADAGEYATALDWATTGLRLALRTGDPEGLANQLLDVRQTSLDKLDRPTDELQQRAQAFLDNTEQVRAERSAPVRESPDEPDDLPDKMTVAWLPTGDYEQAVTHWPEFATGPLVTDANGIRPHAQYCRVVQAKLVEFADAGFARLVIAPVRVAALTAWCAERGSDPGSAEARAAYAADFAVSGDPGLITWPPGRNEPCWCESGRKYKKCCRVPGSEQAQ